MNELDRAEFERLKQRQAALQQQVQNLGRDLQTLEQRLAQPAPAPTSEHAPLTSPAPAPPAPAPAEAPRQATPPPIIPRPAIRTPAPAMAQSQLPQANPPAAPAPQSAEEKSESAPPSPEVRSARKEATPKESSLELRVGTVWLVRFGIVMVLTALGLFGAYAYQNYVPRLGPGGKVGMLYVASFALLGAGAWFQRAEEKLRNYAHVLVAGGLAAVYFTTFAAHHIGALRVIHSALADGALLFGWAGFMVWLADRKKSQTMALFAVLLAYYSSAITRAELFTLYSNLVLTLAAVFFLVRNRWAALSFASLAGTYGGYAFWRFYNENQWELPTQDVWPGYYFLIGYWVIFTAAVFLSKHEEWDDRKRALFLSLNNGAFFTAFLLTMWDAHPHAFWKFSLTYGIALAALALLAKRLRPEERIFRNTYLTQGLVLITLGFVAHFTGLRLALVLAAESVVLTVLGRQTQSRVLQIGSCAAGALAAAFVLPNIEVRDRDGLIIGIAVGAAMLFNAFWTGREIDYASSAKRPQAVLFTVLALAVWLFATWQNTGPGWRALVVTLEAGAFLAAARPLRNQTLEWGSAIFSGLAVAQQISYFASQYQAVAPANRTGWPQGVAVGALMLASALWRRRVAPRTDSRPFEPFVALFSSMALIAWLGVTWTFVPPEFLAPTLAAEALLFTVSFYALRIAEISLFGQGFLVLAQILWIADSTSASPRPWWNPATVIAVTLGVSAWWQRQNALSLRAQFRQIIQGVYALAVVALLFCWLRPQFEPGDWLAAASVLALILTVYGVLARYWLLAAVGQILLVVSGWEFVRQLLSVKPQWYLPLTPVFALLFLSIGTVKWFERRPDANPSVSHPLLNLSLGYRAVALVMTLWWVGEYIPAREQCWVLGLAGVLLFALAGVVRNREALIFSGIFTVCAVARFWFPDDAAPALYWPNFAVLLALAAQQRASKHWRDRYSLTQAVHAAAIVLAALSLWRWLYLWVGAHAQGSFYQTASWSVLALGLFMLGMAWRERVYRWAGLAVLAGALGRVITLDIWRLQKIYQVLSFMALGVVLLGLGFLYNKYQERIKEWL